MARRLSTTSRKHSKVFVRLFAAASVILAATVATGCGSGGNWFEPTPARVSQSQCAEGWNRGMVEMHPTAATLPSTRSLGLVGRHVRMSDGQFGCDIAFLLPHGAAMVFSAAADDNAASEARVGLTWQPTDYLTNRLAPTVDPVSVLPTTWRPACQLTNGRIVVVQSCPPLPASTPRYPITSKLAATAIAEATDHRLIRRAYWLGPMFRSQPAWVENGVELQHHVVPFSASYNVATPNGDMWRVTVVTLRGTYQGLGPCWATFVCADSYQHRRVIDDALVENVHPTPSTTVLVVSYFPTRRGTATSGTPGYAIDRTPMPAWLAQRVRHALRPVPAS